MNAKPWESKKPGPFQPLQRLKVQMVVMVMRDKHCVYVGQMIRLVISTTIRLAIDPVMVKLPAIVVNIAIPVHHASAPSASKKNFNRGTAGTLLKILDKWAGFDIKELYLSPMAVIQ